MWVQEQVTGDAVVALHNLDRADQITIVSQGSVWALEVGINSGSTTDATNFTIGPGAGYASEASAQAALAEILEQLGAVHVPGIGT